MNTLIAIAFSLNGAVKTHILICSLPVRVTEVLAGKQTYLVPFLLCC